MRKWRDDCKFKAKTTLGECRGIRVTSLKHVDSFASDQLIVTGQHRRPKSRWLTSSLSILITFFS